MTKAEMIREIASAADASRIATLHSRLKQCDLSHDEWLDMERLMHARMYDGSMRPLQPAVQFSAYC
ncbi:MAG: hypothetical protein KGR24_06290 [Planctomycetes bacterium]|nr:hypothetical protein [Planctomycetota bacterium]